MNQMTPCLKHHMKSEKAASSPDQIQWCSSPSNFKVFPLFFFWYAVYLRIVTFASMVLDRLSSGHTLRTVWFSVFDLQAAPSSRRMVRCFCEMLDASSFTSAPLPGLLGSSDEELTKTHWPRTSDTADWVTHASPHLLYLQHDLLPSTQHYWHNLDLLTFYDNKEPGHRNRTITQQQWVTKTNN